MKKFFLLVAMLISISWSRAALAESDMVSDRNAPGSFALVESGRAADVYIDPLDHKVVSIAAEDLCDDVLRVTKTRPALKSEASGLSREVVIVGTIDRCGLIKDLIKTKKLDVSHIRGQWESFILAVVFDPLPGVDKALVIAGSDRRGAAFGAYQLSQEIGVSPWCWWADATPDPKKALFVKRGVYQYGPPSVKYRGIFINDEDFGIHPWAAKTFDPQLGDIGPKTYERMFELLLRLKANHLWPAMHNTTRAFNFYPENAPLAHDYAIVMGSAHCEQMLRNNVDEWKRDGKGRWWYQFNRKNILAYWEDRVRENARYENIYTMGMRALHDSPIHAIGTTNTIVKLYERIIADQRGLLKKWVNPDVDKVPQVFCPYNEVLYYYRRGLDLPDDVTILWVNDNHGYIRFLSSPEEQKRSGGSGVYYHVSYWGFPHDYLWICTTSPALIREEMKKAYDYNARRIWMLNVGDLKPSEISTEFFLQMAWDINRWDKDAGHEYLEWFAKREFGEKHAQEVAGIMADYYTLNYQRRPEHMGFNFIPQKGFPAHDPEFSLWNYGDEAQQRIDAFEKIEKRASEIYNDLPESKKDAFYQMVLYQVRGAALMNKKILYAYKSREYAKQGRFSANLYADLAQDAFDAIGRETDYYNFEMAGGKWKYMMSYHPKDLAVFDMPRVGKAGGLRSGLGVAIEGRKRPLSRSIIASTRGLAEGGWLPAFNPFTRKKHFIDVYSKSEEPTSWTAEPDRDWIRLSDSRGEVSGQRRIWVDIDYERLPKRPGERAVGQVRISGNGDEYAVGVEVNNLDIDPPAGSFIEDNGVIAINAENFAEASDGAEGRWEVIDGLGRTGASVGLVPVTMDSVDRGRIVESAPAIEYPIYPTSGGKARLIVQAIPTHEIHDGRELVLAISIDNEAPVVVRFEQGSQMSSPVWWKNVVRATMIAEAEVRIEPGPHRLTVWGLDPSVVIDKIMIDFGGLEQSYLGPEETGVDGD